MKRRFADLGEVSELARFVDSLRANGGYGDKPKLPRCDLGIVLVDASGSLALEETSMVEAGSSVIVLLSKVDRLRPDERWRVHGLVGRSLSASLGVDVPVHLSTAVSSDPMLRDDWIEDGIGVVLRRRQEVRRTSLATKLAWLQRAVIAALERRLALATAPTRRGEAWDEADATLAEAQAALDAALAERSDASAEAASQVAALVDEVAHNAAVLWPQSHEPALDITPLLVNALQARASGVATTVGKQLLKLKAVCSNAFATGGATVGRPPEDVALAAGPGGPLPFDAEAYVEATVLAQPAFPFLGRWRRRASVRRRLLRGPLPPRLAEALASYFGAVDQWRLATLRALRAAVEAERVESQATPGQPGSRARSLAEDIESLRRDLAERMRPANRAETADSG